MKRLFYNSAPRVNEFRGIFHEHRHPYVCMYRCTNYGFLDVIYFVVVKRSRPAFERFIPYIMSEKDS